MSREPPFTGDDLKPTRIDRMLSQSLEKEAHKTPALRVPAPGQSSLPGTGEFRLWNDLFLIIDPGGHPFKLQVNSSHSRGIMGSTKGVS